MKAFLAVMCLLSSGSLIAQTWLSLPSNTGHFQVGDCDVPGNQLTVECLYTSTNTRSVDFVSKHSGPGDVNYLLRRALLGVFA